MSGEFIDDPLGIILFNEPTEVEVSYGGATSTSTVRVLPYSSKQNEETFWAGPDTYRVPVGAEYTILEDLDLTQSDINISPDDSKSISLQEVLSPP